MKSCPSCDIELPDDVKFCTDCGNPLPEKKSNNALNIALIVCGLMAIGLGGLVGYTLKYADPIAAGWLAVFAMLLLWILLITTGVIGSARLYRTGLPQPLKGFLIILSSSPAWIWIPAIFIIV